MQANIHPIALVEVAFGSVTNAYSANQIPSTARNCSAVVVSNALDVSIYLSCDGGTNPSYYLKSGQILNATDVSISDLRIKYADTAPTKGAVYITPHVI